LRGFSFCLQIFVRTTYACVHIYAVLVILQITILKIMLWHGKFQIRNQGADCSKEQCWLPNLILVSYASHWFVLFARVSCIDLSQSKIRNTPLKFFDVICHRFRDISISGFGGHFPLSIISRIAQGLCLKTLGLPLKFWRYLSYFWRQRIFLVSATIPLFPVVCRLQHYQLWYRHCRLSQVCSWKETNLTFFYKYMPPYFFIPKCNMCVNIEAKHNTRNKTIN